MLFVRGRKLTAVFESSSLKCDFKPDENNGQNSRKSAFYLQIRSRFLFCKKCLGFLSFVPDHFFRTTDGHEIDLVLRLGGKVYAIEIKLTSNPSPDDMRRLKKAAEWVHADHCLLVCRIPTSVFGAKESVCRLGDLLPWLNRQIQNARVI